MKKLFFVLLVLTTVFSGCKKDEPEAVLDREKFIGSYTGTKTLTVNYNGQNYNPTVTSVTEMAKVFGKEVARFMENDGTQKFIDACLNTRNSSFLIVESRDDLVTSKQKSGTWMHRILALKFAAWLNPDFEVWIYYTVDKMIYEFAQELENSIGESILLQRQQDEIKNKLAKESSEFMEYLTIEQKIINSRTRRRLATKNKFKEVEDLFSQKNKED